jgi:hypothetical protein
VNLNFANCRVRVWGLGFFCVLTVVPRPLLEFRWMGCVIQILGFSCIDCCVSGLGG